MGFTWSDTTKIDSGTNTTKTTTTPISNEQIKVTPKYPEPIPNYQQGWVCPKCGRALAPWVGSCFCTYKGFTITCNTTY